MTARSLAEQALELAGKAPPRIYSAGEPDAAKEFYLFARTALPALAERVLALEEACQEAGHDPSIRANADCLICRALTAKEEA